METAKQSVTSGEGKTSSGATDEDDETIKGTTTVKKWRAVKKAASITRDKKTWYWCPKHVLLSKFDDLYVTHKPESHVDYKNAKERGQRDKEKTNKKEKGAPKYKKKLQLTDKMKSIFMLNFNMDKEDIDAMWNAYSQGKQGAQRTRRRTFGCSGCNS